VLAAGRVERRRPDDARARHRPGATGRDRCRAREVATGARAPGTRSARVLVRPGTQRWASPRSSVVAEGGRNGAASESGCAECREDFRDAREKQELIAGTCGHLISSEVGWRFESHFASG
jgi:hypothetical protein